jgi:hypothetical protein
MGQLVRVAKAISAVIGLHDMVEGTTHSMGPTKSEIDLPEGCNAQDLDLPRAEDGTPPTFGA